MVASGDGTTGKADGKHAGYRGKHEGITPFIIGGNLR